MSKKAIFNMQITETQKQLVDFLLFIDYGNAGVSRAAYVLELVRERAKNYLSFPSEFNVSDEELFNLVVEKHQDGVKSIVGEELYNKFINMPRDEFEKETGVKVEGSIELGSDDNE